MHAVRTTVSTVLISSERSEREPSALRPVHAFYAYASVSRPQIGEEERRQKCVQRRLRLCLTPFGVQHELTRNSLETCVQSGQSAYHFRRSPVPPCILYAESFT